MLKKISLFLTASLLVVSTSAFSQTAISGMRTIDQLSCFPGTETCRVTISGGAVGPSACRSRQLSVDVSTSAGRASYAVLLTTQLASGSLVYIVNTDDASCTAEGFPVFTELRSVSQ